MWPWGVKKRFLSPHLEKWQMETWRYLLRHVESIDHVIARRPLTPSDPMLARPSSRDHTAAILLFERLKEYMRLEDCPVELVKRTERGGPVDTYLHLQQKGPLGSFEEYNGRLYITYAPNLLKDMPHLAAVLGHELAHYALFTIREPAPGVEDDPKVIELVTDVATCFFGLGILQANSAFEFEQTQDFDRQSWRAQFSGYLSEEGRIFSLALHLALRGEREAPDLKPNLQKLLARAMARIDAEPSLLASLREF